MLIGKPIWGCGTFRNLMEWGVGENYNTEEGIGRKSLTFQWKLICSWDTLHKRKKRFDFFWIFPLSHCLCYVSLFLVVHRNCFFSELTELRGKKSKRRVLWACSFQFFECGVHTVAPRRCHCVNFSLVIDGSYRGGRHISEMDALFIYLFSACIDLIKRLLGLFWSNYDWSVHRAP